MTTSTRHLVLLTAHYPPSTAAGARRPANLATHFLERGWRVSVVACGDPARDWQTSPSGIRTRFVAIPGQYRRATEAAPPSRAEPAESGPTAARWSGRQGRLRRQLVALQAFPDLWRDAESPMVDAAREAIGDDRGTVLYSTAPPITTHQAARRIAREFPGLPWVAEYRDPWIEPGTQRLRWSGTVMAPASHLLIRRLVGRPDAHVAVSAGIAEWLERRDATDIITALNGIPDQLLEDRAVAVEPGVIRYLGEFYLGRDPEPLFAALGRLASGATLPAGWRLDLIGNVHAAVGSPTEVLLSRHGIAERTTLSGRVAHETAVARTAAAGLLVLLAQRQPDQIPNKLFEYLGARRPILAVVDRDGETHRLLTSLQADEFVLTAGSSAAEWDRTVAAAVRRGTSAAPWGADPAQLRQLATSHQLPAVEQRCRSLTGR